MTLLDRLLRREPAELPRLKAVSGAGLIAYATDRPLSSLSATPQERAAQFLRAYKVGWFYKAERKISGDIATLEWSVSQGDVESGAAETVIDHPDLDIPFGALSPIEQFIRLLERPNPSQTGRQLFQKTQIRRDMAGTAFWYLENATFGLPTAIYGISPSRMTPARDKSGALIGWVMDKDAPSGGVPFDVSEIVNFPMASAGDGDDDLFGVGVVESVMSELPLSDLMARHTGDLLTTGGRLAGMISPKDRALDENEYQDVVRSWRNVASDPNAARRLLVFPEPMEYSAGASTPSEIGIPELAALNRDNILTAFPISPEMLGVPMPSGLNASGESREKLREFYWADTINPRVDDLKEVIQTQIVSLYERAMGQTFDFDMAIPNLDTAATIIEKVGAFKGLVSVGFDPEEAIAAVDLEHIKWLGLPAILDPAKQLEMQQAAQEARAQQPPPGDTVTTTTSATLRGPQESTQVKAAKAKREQVTATAEKVGTDTLTTFFLHQRDRLAQAIAATLPPSKSERRKAIGDDWWDKQREDDALKSAMRTLYVEVGRGALQIVVDAIDKTPETTAVKRVLRDLLAYGGDRITDINENTHLAVKAQLTEGVRRGYSIEQLTNGYPEHDFPGVKGALLDNGVPAFDGYRAEMIARTETALSYNRSALSGYDYFGIKEVQAIDGDGDEVCAARDGLTFGVDEAMSIEDHPNGTLDWIPIVPEKAAWGPEQVRELVAAMKSEPPVVNVEAPVVNMPPIAIAPEGTSEALKTQADAIRELVDEMRAIKTEAPVVNVPAPIVNLPAPIVNVPPVKAPDVKVNVDSVRVVSMPDRSHQIVRDRTGKPTHSVETDA